MGANQNLVPAAFTLHANYAAFPKLPTGSKYPVVAPKNALSSSYTVPREPLCYGPGDASNALKTVVGPVGGFCFNSTDSESTTDDPQGITTTRDAATTSDGAAFDQQQMVVVSWTTSTEINGKAGSFLTLVDTDPNFTGNDYVKVLLVAPSGTGAGLTLNNIPIHAGGIVWRGDYLYVADTNGGLRVFDMRDIRRTDTMPGYHFVLSQIGTVQETDNGQPLNNDPNSTSILKLRWSSISLDEATGELLVVESQAPAVCLTNNPNPHGLCSNVSWETTRLVGFAFPTGSDKFPAGTGVNVTSDRAAYLPWWNVQGVAAHAGRLWVDSSGSGEIDNHLLHYVTLTNGVYASTTSEWPTAAESMSYLPDPNGADLIWTLREAPTSRNVFHFEQSEYN